MDSISHNLKGLKMTLNVSNIFSQQKYVNNMLEKFKCVILLLLMLSSKPCLNYIGVSHVNSIYLFWSILNQLLRQVTWLQIYLLIFRSICIASIYVLFGLPLPLVMPSTCIAKIFLTNAIASLRWTCLNHPERVSLIFLPIDANT